MEGYIGERLERVDVVIQVTTGTIDRKDSKNEILFSVLIL
jgi:hypothetical protein